jgi:hypothetical protein
MSKRIQYAGLVTIVLENLKPYLGKILYCTMRANSTKLFRNRFTITDSSSAASTSYYCTKCQ